MPCTYSVVDLKEREREAEKRRAEEAENKKREIERKKKALITALGALGFDVEAQSLGDGKTLITGAQND